MILNKKLALAYLLLFTLLCFGCASEVPPQYLSISTGSSDERSERERLEEFYDQRKEEAAQICNIDQLENTATKVIAAIFPEKDLSGRLMFFYGVSSYSIDMGIAEVHENGEKNYLRIMIFSQHDCSLSAMKRY